MTDGIDLVWKEFLVWFGLVSLVLISSKPGYLFCLWTKLCGKSLGEQNIWKRSGEGDAGSFTMYVYENLGLGL